MTDTNIPAPPVVGEAFEMQTLRTRISVLEDNLRATHRRHEQDINVIGEALMELAEEHGWCSTYDDEVSRLNGRLHIQLPERIKTYRATIHVQVTFESTPDKAEGIASEVAHAIYSYGDDLGDTAYRVQNAEIYDFEED